MKEVLIRTTYITLGQFLKFADFIATGGEAKPFLAEATVFVNGVRDERRGRKLYPGDQVNVNGQDCFVKTDVD